MIPPDLYLRDYFAAMALQAIITASAQPAYAPDNDMHGHPGERYRPATSFWTMREEGPGETPDGHSAEDTHASIAAWEAYAFADAMLKERSKPVPTPEEQPRERPQS